MIYFGGLVLSILELDISICVPGIYLFCFISESSIIKFISF